MAYSRYGGRGIIVCERWHDLENFVLDNEHLAKPGLTLDRRNNDGPYSPDNCRWVTHADQKRNMHNNLWIEFEGRSMIAADWSKEVGIKETTIKQRLRKGWTTERALTTPNLRPRRRQCTYADCGKKHFAHGYCREHYRRQNPPGS